MSTLEIKVSHQLTQAEALSRIKKFLPELKSQHAEKISDIEESWDGNNGIFKFKIKGFKISGRLKVKEKQVLLNGDLPFLALPFKGTIEETIRAKASELLKG